MDEIDINAEIHFLIKLPSYLKQKQEELNNIDDYIGLPSQSVDSTGNLSSGGASIHVQAMSLNKRRSRIERNIKRAKKKSSLLVQAIKTLDELDKKRLIEHYQTDENIDVQDIFKKITVLIKKQVRNYKK